MNREDIEKLLGGFATGSLTKEEEQALFSAALEDQQLFNELAREQALRDVLDDPAARASLLAQLSDTPAPWYRKLGAWVTRPRNAAVLATAVFAAIAFGTWQLRPRKQAIMLTAEVKESAPVEALRDAPPSPPPATKPALPSRREVAAPSTAPVKQRALASAPSAPAPSAPVAPREVAPTAATAEPQNSPSSAAPGAILDRPLAGVAGGVVTGSAQKAAEADAEAGRAAKDVTAANGVAPMAQPVVTAPPQGLQVQAASARLAIAMAKVAPPVSWTVLTKQPDGTWAVANSADLPSGDPVTLRLEAKNSGYVYVAEDDKLLTSSAVQPGKPFDATLDAHAPGKREVQVWFSPRMVLWPAAAKKKAPVFRDKAEDSLQQQPIQAVRLTLVYK